MVSPAPNEEGVTIKIHQIWTRRSTHSYQNAILYSKEKTGNPDQILMKSLLACLFCGLSPLSFIQGAPAVLNPNVEKPPYPDFVKHSEYTASGLKDLLDQGRLEEFYKRSKKLLKVNGRIQDKNTEQVQNDLWTFYYLRRRPFPMDASPEIPDSWREDKTLDYDVKTSAARYIATQV